MLRMRFIRERQMTTEPSAGNAPPLKPVPEPRATKGMLCFAQMRIIDWTCSVVRGSVTAPGMMRNAVRPSHSYV